MPSAKPISIPLPGSARVSGLLQVPRRARACYVLAHGAGAGMTHPFLVAVADGLAARGIGTLRFQFPYLERGSRRPDPPAVAQTAVRAAVEHAQRKMPKVPLFAGGKSYGGRMTSQAQAASPLPGIRGLIFLGFPLHPAGKPSSERAKHLTDLTLPMLFLQGTKDDLAELKRIKAVCRKLGPRATLRLFEAANHSFHVPVRSGRTNAEVMTSLLDTVADWIAARIAPR